MRDVATTLLFCVLFLALIFVAQYGFDKQDKVDCNSWAAQADVYPLFTLTTNEKAQCDYWKIPVNAPVKDN